MKTISNSIRGLLYFLIVMNEKIFRNIVNLLHRSLACLINTLIKLSSLMLLCTSIIN